MKQANGLIGCLALLLAATAGISQTPTNQTTTELIGWVTNGPAVLQAYQITTRQTNQIVRRVPPHLATNAVLNRLQTQSWTYTNLVFDHFLPDSLHHLIWTNFVAHTNGREMRIWSERSHPPGWPTNPPAVSWNTNSLIWGLKGMTALSPCWANEKSSGQVPFTVLTRRHAYTRGHGMGPDGFNTYNAGYKAWFLAADNSLVEIKVARSVMRIKPGTNQVHQDYTIMLFDRDLPEKIETMRVALPEEVQKYYSYPQGGAPHPIFQTEQGGDVSTSVPPLTVNTWKGGDSGSPNMLPLPGELVFYSGRSTTGPSRAMQEDMDELCRLEKLNPAKYQMRWVDLENYMPK